MRCTDEKAEIPNLWLHEGSFGGRRPSNRCGTVAPYTEEVRAAMRIRPVNYIAGTSQRIAYAAAAGLGVSVLDLKSGEKVAEEIEAITDEILTRYGQA